MLLTPEQVSMMHGLICPYCGKPSEHVDAKRLYGEKTKIEGMFYACFLCRAWVGTHADNPLISFGRLSKSELRHKHQETHKIFDQLWIRRIYTRVGAYKMLAKELRIPKKYCHIGMFGIETCNKVIEIASKILKQKEFPNYKDFNKEA